MKTKEELNALKEEFVTVSKKLHELSDEELEQIRGGCGAGIYESDRGVSGIVEKLLEAIKKLREKSGNQ